VAATESFLIAGRQMIRHVIAMITSMHVYEVRPRKDKRGFDLISDVLPFRRLCYDTPDHAIGWALHPKAGEKREKLAMLWRYIVKKESQAKKTNA
jgi:hypothetical protein